MLILQITMSWSSTWIPPVSRENVVLHGRVLDAAGNGLPFEPLELSIKFSSVRKDGPSSSMQRVQLDKITTRSDGSFQLPPRQILSPLTIPASSSESTGKLVVTISSNSRDAEFHAEKELTIESTETWNVHDIELPDLVLPPPITRPTLQGRMLDSQGQPLAGKTVWLADRLNMLRTVTDRAGEFRINEVASPAWLLSKEDWSIHAIQNLTQPFELKTNSAAQQPSVAPVVNAPQSLPLSQLSAEQRSKLVEGNIKGMLTLQKIAGIGIYLPQQAYLDPDAYYKHLSQSNGLNLDGMRWAFADFWKSLSEEQLLGLASATTNVHGRQRLLGLRAERYPSPMAFEQTAQVDQCGDWTDYDAQLRIGGRGSCKTVSIWGARSTSSRVTTSRRSVVQASACAWSQWTTDRSVSNYCVSLAVGRTDLARVCFRRTRSQQRALLK